jgi:hypothetical protein
MKDKFSFFGCMSDFEGYKIFKQKLELGGHILSDGPLGNDFYCDECGGYFWKHLKPTLYYSYRNKKGFEECEIPPTCNELIIKDIIE